MVERLNRRSLLKRTAALAGVAVGAHLARGPILLASEESRSKLRIVQIGCGGRGREAHLPNVIVEQLVAVVDVDETHTAKGLKYLEDNAKKFKLENLDLSKVKTFTEYRKMFDTFDKEFDAVSIATPDHQHALPSLMAIQHGKHVFCEKPLTHNIAEARILGQAARKSKVATQMGNQGLGAGGDQALAEFLEAGAIGTVTEVHTWHGFGDRFGGSFPRPPAEPVPEGMHWDDWIGAAPYREYHDKIERVKAKKKDKDVVEDRCYWHGYHDFGTGSLGGWGTHMWDAIGFALKLTYPTTVEVLKMEDASDERFPRLTTIRFDFPAAGKRPALKVFWYEGGHVKGDKDLGPESDVANTAGAHRPPLAAEIEKKYARKLGNAGSILVGEKGMITVGSHGAAPVIVPEERRKEFTPPPQTLPRYKGGIWADFVRAAKAGGPRCVSDFADFSGPLLEAMYVGHLAMRAGIGKKVEWDAPNMKCTNMPDLNQYVGRTYRKGWEVV